jgi:NTP pyrophosphatase (non-canonical NTP hydrolase)
MTESVLDEVRHERGRQEELFKSGKHKKRMADPKGMTHLERLAVLAEEFGEVSRELAEGIGKSLDIAHLRTELIQTAAVCAAWVEVIDAERTTKRVIGYVLRGKDPDGTWYLNGNLQVTQSRREALFFASAQDARDALAEYNEDWDLTRTVVRVVRVQRP